MFVFVIRLGVVVSGKALSGLSQYGLYEFISPYLREVFMDAVSRRVCNSY